MGFPIPKSALWCFGPKGPRGPGAGLAMWRESLMLGDLMLEHTRSGRGHSLGALACTPPKPCPVPATPHQCPYITHTQILLWAGCGGPNLRQRFQERGWDASHPTKPPVNQTRKRCLGGPGQAQTSSQVSHVQVHALLSQSLHAGGWPQCGENTQGEASWGSSQPLPATASLEAEPVCTEPPLPSPSPGGSQST